MTPMTISKPLNREELIMVFCDNHRSVVDRISHIVANTRLEQEKLVDAQMAEISRLQVLAEKQDKALAAQKEIIMELLDAFYVTVQKEDGTVIIAYRQKGDIAATKALAYAVKQGWIKKEQVIR